MFTEHIEPGDPKLVGFRDVQIYKVMVWNEVIFQTSFENVTPEVAHMKGRERFVNRLSYVLREQWL